MLKRFLSLILSMLIIFGVFSASMIINADQSKDENLAYFLVNDKGWIEKHNMDLVEPDINIDPTMVERDGKKGIWLTDSGGDNIFNLYLSVAEDFAFQVDDGTEFIVEIDYYALDTSIFYCTYDAVDNIYKDAGLGQYLIGVDDVNKWNTMTFNLSDAYFGDRIGPTEGEQFDFDINAGQDGTILINSVRVRKIPKQNKLYVTNLKTNNVGGIFGDNEEQKFSFDVVNTTNATQTQNLFYRVVTEDGNRIVWESESEVTVKPHRTKHVEAIADCKEFGIFYLEAGIKGEGFEQKDFIPFSLVDVIDDGTKNKKFGWCQLFATQFDPNEQLELAKRSNSGMARAGFGWSEIVTETPNGITYAIPPEVVSLMEDLRDEGMGFVMNIACLGNEIFDGVGENRMPIDEHLRKPYLEFVDYFCKAVKDLGLEVYGWEFWNEPNLQKFNNEMASGTEYGKLAIDVANKVHETFPGVDIYNASLTALSAQSTIDYYEDMLKTGIGEYANGISLHSYSHNLIPEIGCVADIEYYLKRFEEYFGYKPKTSCSELGYVTQPFVSGSLVTNDLTLAKFNTRQYIFMNAKDLFDNYAWYMLSDSGTNKRSMEHVFGQTEVGWIGLGGKQRLAAKESYVALSFMNNILQDAECEKTIIEKDENYAYIFRRPKDNATIMPVWTSGDARTISFKCDAPSLTLYDMYGNPETIYGHNGVYSVSAIDAVQYLEGDLENVEICSNPVELSSTDIIAPIDNDMPITLMTSDHKGLKAELTSSSPEFTVVKETVEFGDQGAVVTFHTPATKGEKTNLTLRVKDGDKLIYKYQIPVELSDEISISALTSASGGVDIWGMEVKLNNHSTVPMDGKISIVSPKELADSFENVEFDTIPAGKTGKIVFTPQKIEKIGLYPTVFKVETSNGKTFELPCNLDFSVANYATVKPTIDGYINEEEWNFGSKLGTRYKEQVVFRASYNWGGINDLSSDTMVKYDEDNFYMAVIVKDDTHVPLPVGENAVNIWQYDSMQFGISFEHYMTDDVIGGTFTEISFGETYDGTWVYRGMSERNNLPQMQLTDEMVDCAVRRDGSNTYYEICIPWSEITVLDIDFDTLDALTFSMLLNDNDGAGRKGWMEYGSGIGSRKDVTLFTSLQLVK